MQFKSPEPEDLERIKKELGYSSTKMAELFGVATGRQWRRYTSQADDPKNKREMGMHMLFFAMARLTLKPEDIEKVLAKMREAGAVIDLDSPDS